MSVRPLCGLLVAVIVGGGAEAALAQFDKAVELKKLLEKNDYKVELSSERLSATHAQWLNMTIPLLQGRPVAARLAGDDGVQDRRSGDAGEQAELRRHGHADLHRDENDLIFEAWFPGQFEREMFEKLLEAWHNDTIGQSETIRSELKM